MIELIIFDWDDVITIGSTKGYFSCYHETLTELEVFLDPEEEARRILAQWSRPHREELKELLKEKPELLDKACEIYENKLFGDTFVKELHLVEGAIDLLKNLKHSGYTLAVATGINPKLLKEVIMPKFNIPPIFSQIISAYEINDATRHKPHPYMLEKIMGSMGIKPKHTLFIGDAKTDVFMAQRAKVTPVVVLTGHLTKEEARRLRVEYTIEDITRLTGVLKKINVDQI